MTENATVNIIVMTHKAYRMPDDAMYIPMQVGAALSVQPDGTPLDLGYLRDDEGENISEKNPLYCELTGLYWAWKHLDAQYVGLVHYRRYFGSLNAPKTEDVFEQILRSEELEPMLRRYRVFVPVKRRYYIETLYSHYEHTHYVRHLDVTRQILEERCPEYLGCFDRVMKQTSGYMFNMMIMERALLDRYCEWLFDILGELEKRVDAASLSYYQGRYCGRVGELILNVWLERAVETGELRQSDIRELPFLYTEPVNWRRKVICFLKAKFLHERYEF